MFGVLFIYHKDVEDRSEKRVKDHERKPLISPKRKRLQRRKMFPYRTLAIYYTCKHTSTKNTSS